MEHVCNDGWIYEAPPALPWPHDRLCGTKDALSGLSVGRERRHHSTAIARRMAVVRSHIASYRVGRSFSWSTIDRMSSRSRRSGLPPYATASGCFVNTFGETAPFISLYRLNA